MNVTGNYFIKVIIKTLRKYRLVKIIKTFDRIAIQFFQVWSFCFLKEKAL